MNIITCKPKMAPLNTCLYQPLLISIFGSFNSHSLRILYILENYYPNIGGVETLFKSLVDNIRNEGYEVTIITNKTNHDLPFRERSDNLTIYRFPFSSRYAFTFLAWLPATIQAFKHDLIHTTSYNAGIPAFIASFISRKKVIITFHEVWGRLWFKLPFFRKIGMWLHYIFERFLLKLHFDKFVAVSDYTKYRLVKAGVKEKKVVRIYNGIKYNHEQSAVPAPDNHTYRFLYFGRLGISKGLDILLGAVKILSDKDKEFEMRLIIPSVPKNLRQMVTDLINQFGIEKSISIKSDLTDKELVDEINSADAIVVPSYSEGFCFTAVESIAMNKPIISSDRGALKEVVSGKFLKMTEHTDSNLAECMIQALNDGWEHSEVKKFPLHDTIQSYKELYATFRK